MIKQLNIKNKIIRSEEILSHFQCGYCKKWWSIGDAPLEIKEWYCPWCGKCCVVK